MGRLFYILSSDWCIGSIYLLSFLSFIPFFLHSFLIIHSFLLFLSFFLSFLFLFSLSLSFSKIGSITKNLDYLVVGESKPTKKKIDQAKNLNIKIILEKEWNKILNN